MRSSCAWKRLMATALIGAALGAVLAGCGQGADKHQPKPEVVTTTPRRGTVARHVETNASLDALETTDLYAQITGYVAEVRSDIGDRVKAGQVLATIDVPELQKALMEATAQLEARRSDKDFQDATFKRQQSLYGEHAITDQALDEARAKAALGTAQLGEAEARVRRLKAQVAYAEIRAPYDGIVTRRQVNRGDLVQPATGGRAGPLFTVQRVDTIRAFCDVPESEASYVALNDEATIKPYGLASKQFAGKVTRFSHRLDPDTRNMRTEIDLPNPTGELYAGMYAQVALTLDKHEQALILPTTAIGNDNDGAYVLAVEGDRTVRKPVKTGLVDGASTEILDGVAEDTVVVATAKGAPPPGAVVTVKRAGN